MHLGVWVTLIVLCILLMLAGMFVAMDNPQPGLVDGYQKHNCTLTNATVTQLVDCGEAPDGGGIDGYFGVWDAGPDLGSAILLPWAGHLHRKDAVRDIFIYYPDLPVTVPCLCNPEALSVPFPDLHPLTCRVYAACQLDVNVLEGVRDRQHGALTAALVLFCVGATPLVLGLLWICLCNK